MRKIVVNIARLLLALTFILSGFVKAVDPLGTKYKISDYLTAMGLGQWMPDFLTLGASVVLLAVEFMIGICLLFAIHRRLVSKLTLAIMVVMTALTLWLAIENPISDCGCFGDAIVLTNWQTFWKNMVLLAATLIIWRWPTDMIRLISASSQWIVFNFSTLFILFIAGWCLYDLPLFDFRPYHVGVNIQEGMEVPEGAPLPQFETTFILEKDGLRQEFTTDNYPDSTWTFIDSKTVQTAEGYVPPIHDFSILTNEGEDITEEVLSHQGYTFLLISPHLENADDSQLDLINQMYEYSKEQGYPFYCLTASTDKAISRWQEMTGADYPFCSTDEITLKTIIRSNPGLVLLKQGTVLHKWSHNNLPVIKEEQYAKPLEQLVHGQVQTDSVPGKIAKILMWFVLPLVLLTLADRLWAWTKWIQRKTKLMKNPKEQSFIFKKSKNIMRKKIVAGNWKMNMNLQDGIALAKELNETLKADKPNCGVVICTPFIHLASIAQFLDQDIIGLGAENCADKEKGAYTGEVSAEMVKSTGAQYVILGHSERREYYKETPEILKEKVLLAQKNDLKVIFCIGESLEEREAGKQNEVVKAELEGSVFNLSEEDFRKVVIAYEPIWAIGTGKTATAEQAEEIHAYIRSIIAEKYGQAVADDTTILYGGSCKASNAPELFAKPDIDGGLIGGASLKAADFKGIIDAWKK
ncbi:MAG: triose-phosphate isomerase [Prevotella sp.]|jgi:triosephosphate isomerase|nr:triose-phosphate isomerase [Prevotella sp.]